MTMPDERIRALLWAGSFLIELARDDSLPLDVRRRAVVIARHFPTVEDISILAQFRHLSVLDLGLESPADVCSKNDEGRFGLLRYSTKLAWPEED